MMRMDCSTHLSTFFFQTYFNNGISNWHSATTTEHGAGHGQAYLSQHYPLQHWSRFHGAWSVFRSGIVGTLPPDSYMLHLSCMSFRGVRLFQKARHSLPSVAM